jgi:hypothetical protein
MQRARQIILGADRRVTECVKWRTPTFEFRGPIASFQPAKKIVSVMFHRGAEIPGEHRRLEGDGRLVRVMRFAGVEEVEAARTDLEAVIRAWWTGRHHPRREPSRAGPDAAASATDQRVQKTARGRRRVTVLTGR